MNIRPTPTVATWILKKLCPVPELESIMGDLTEEYQRGRGSLWYWRQVLNVVVLGIYSQTSGRNLVVAKRFPMGAVFALILFVVTISALAVSPLSPIFLIVILAGIFIGGLKFALNRAGQAPASTVAPEVIRIDSSKIPIGGGLGAGIIILILLSGVLYDLEPLRFLAVPGIFLGLVFAVILRFWRRTHVPASPLITLGLKSSADAKRPSNSR